MSEWAADRWAITDVFTRYADALDNKQWALEIQQLYVRYAFAVDMNELDDYVACWAQDGEYVGFREGGQPHARGHAEIREFAAKSYKPADNGYHWCTGPLIEPTDYGASGRCYLMHVLARDDGTFGEVRHVLYYRDELVKEDGRWVFRLRNTTALPAGRLVASGSAI